MSGPSWISTPAHTFKGRPPPDANMTAMSRSRPQLIAFEARSPRTSEGRASHGLTEDGMLSLAPFFFPPSPCVHGVQTTLHSTSGRQVGRYPHKPNQIPSREAATINQIPKLHSPQQSKIADALPPSSNPIPTPPQILPSHPTTTPRHDWHNARNANPGSLSPHGVHQRCVCVRRAFPSPTNAIALHCIA